MAVHKKVKELVPSADKIDAEINDALGEYAGDGIEGLYSDSVRNFQLDTIIPGKVVNIVNDEVVVDVGYKSEGVLSVHEFGEGEDVEIGDEVEVLLEGLDDHSGMIMISKRKADRLKGWELILSTKKEGDIIKGRVIRKIKGGLLLDVGAPVFMPASQISIRRTGDIGEYIGKELECRILKIDESRMNIVVSRRKLIEEEREKKKKKLLEELQEGQTVTGVVKNIVDFGAFVDLGGIDGLLHITDMSWGRINHPSEILAIDDEIDVKILGIDYGQERIALGLKQKSKSPWVDVEEKYPVGGRVKGRVVNVMSYGAFVKLETGIEGLVHISEMSWTKRINHPSEVVQIGDIVDVIILDINKEKQEISLGMKQTEADPWTLVEEKYPEGTILRGRVRNLTNYGAFIEIEEGIDGLLHVSDMSWVKKVNHPSEVLQKGDEVEVKVLSVDRDKKRVALGMKQLEEDPWEGSIQGRFNPEDIVKGKVTKLTNFGAFVEIEPGLEGLLHISELSDDKVENPSEIVEVDQEVEVKILRIDAKERKIALSLLDDVGAMAALENATAQAESEEAAAEEDSSSEASEEDATAEGDDTPSSDTGIFDLKPRADAEGEEASV